VFTPTDTVHFLFVLSANEM